MPQHLVQERRQATHNMANQSALPAGLHMNWRNGTIGGTPTSSYSNTSHTVYANISGNSVSTTIYLEFQIEAPDISYVQNDLTLTKVLQWV